MKLVIDVGNSRVKWAWAKEGRLVDVGAADRHSGVWERSIFDAGHLPEEIRVANVAGPGVEAQVKGVLAAGFGVNPVFASSAARGAGVRNGYADPAQLGVDRWLALCAAWVRHGSRLCVVDAGTATTFDIVTDDGQHAGGLILAGLDLLQSALIGGTSDLARLSATASEVAARPGDAGRLGRDTATGIRQGAVLATAHLAIGCLRSCPARSGAPPVLVLTGGASSVILPALRDIAGGPVAGAIPPFALEERPELVLEGLALDPPCFARTS